MNGYSEKQTKELIEMAYKAKLDGASLTGVFQKFAKTYDRAQGSVRNYYYSIVSKAENGDKTYKDLIDGKNLQTQDIVKFSKDDEYDLLKEVLKGISKGKSVRRVIKEISGGDLKLELRKQNKYRNLISHDKELVERVKADLKLEGIETTVTTPKPKIDNTLLYKRLTKEINGLVDRLKGDLKTENEILKSENTRLREENDRLKKIAFSPLDTKVGKYYKDKTTSEFIDKVNKM